MKLLDKNAGINLYDFALGNGFLHITLKTQLTKYDKVYFIKIKSFNASKYNIQKVKTQ